MVPEKQLYDLGQRIKNARIAGLACDTGLGVKRPGLMLPGSAPLACPLELSSGLSDITIACLEVKIKHLDGPDSGA
jgi:hypothetical protein